MIYEWVKGVNQRILRDGASWSNIVGFKEDVTRSGKTKRRLYSSQTKRAFAVKMHFTLEEYNLFNSWYKNVLRNGLYGFRFPKIDSDGSIKQSYRFSSDGVPSFTNPGGNIIECTMTWEEM